MVIKVGVIGLGRSGWDIHCNAILNNDRYKITAVCDLSVERLRYAKKELNCLVFNNFEDFSNCSEFKLAIIASPSKEHFIMAKLLMEKGISVVIEKPIADSSEEAKELFRISKSLNVLLVPFYNFRFANDYLKILEIFNKKLENVFLIKRRVTYFNRRDDWQAWRKNNGGIIQAAAVHHIDQILNLVQSSVKNYWVDLRKVISKGDAPDHLKLLIKFENNIVADIEISWAELETCNEWEIYGKNGSARSKSGELVVTTYAEEDLSYFDRGDRSYLANETVNWKADKTLFSSYFSNNFYSQLDLALNGKGSVPVSMESAIKTMLFLEDIEREFK